MLMKFLRASCYSRARFTRCSWLGAYVLRMRSAMPDEESVIVLMAKMAMDKSSYYRALPYIDHDEKLFPNEKNHFLDLINKVTE